MTEWVQFAQQVGALGVPALLVLLGIVFWLALQKEWLVPGATHRDVKAQRDRLLDLALENAAIAREATAKAVRKARAGGTTKK